MRNLHKAQVRNDVSAQIANYESKLVMSKNNPEEMSKRNFGASEMSTKVVPDLRARERNEIVSQMFSFEEDHLSRQRIHRNSIQRSSLISADKPPKFPTYNPRPEHLSQMKLFQNRLDNRLA